MQDEGGWKERKRKFKNEEERRKGGRRERKKESVYAECLCIMPSRWVLKICEDSIITSILQVKVNAYAVLFTSEMCFKISQLLDFIISVPVEVMLR